MSQIKQFLDQLIAGQNAEAKETLENEISAKAFAHLEEYKKQIASTMFGEPTPVEEGIDVNTIKAAQKTASEKPLFNRDPESDRNAGKKYGSRQDAKSDDEDDEPKAKKK
jgi:hypothetical protein